MPDPAGTEIVHRLPRDPVHLYQLNEAPGTYNNPMGCGAFSTAMALSVYDPAQYGTYATARDLFAHMLKVPFLGGTWEHADGAVARAHGFFAESYGFGTLDDLAAAIDLGAPAVLLINPGFLGIGKHDVLLVGYSVDPNGLYLRLFIDNPWLEAATQPAPAGLSYPGNAVLEVADLPHQWTHVLTPIFADAERAAEWRRQTHHG